MVTKRSDIKIFNLRIISEKRSLNSPKQLVRKRYKYIDRFFACSSDTTFLIVQTFDKQVFAELKNQTTVVKAVFLNSEMQIAILDELNVITIFDFELSKIVAIRRLPSQDIVT